MNWHACVLLRTAAAGRACYCRCMAQSMVLDLASRLPVSAVPVVALEDAASARRWREWQVRNAVTSRADARRARIAFTLLFVATGAWLGLQLLGRSF